MALFAEVLEVNSLVNAADELSPIESMHDNSGKAKVPEDVKKRKEISDSGGSKKRKDI